MQLIGFSTDPHSSDSPLPPINTSNSEEVDEQEIVKQNAILLVHEIAIDEIKKKTWKKLQQDNKEKIVLNEQRKATIKEIEKEGSAALLAIEEEKKEIQQIFEAKSQALDMASQKDRENHQAKMRALEVALAAETEAHQKEIERLFQEKLAQNKRSNQSDSLKDKKSDFAITQKDYQNEKAEKNELSSVKEDKKLCSIS
jgi:hypothetical protein